MTTPRRSGLSRLGLPGLDLRRLGLRELGLQGPRSMAGQLLLALSVGATLAFLATTILVSAADADRLGRQRQTELDTLAGSLAHLLAPKLWNLDPETARKDLVAIAQRPEILHVRALDEQGRTFAEVGAPPEAGRALLRSAPIRFHDEYVDRRIGTVLLAVETDGFWGAFYDRLTTLAPILGVILVVAWALIFRQIHRAVQRPITLLTAAMAQARTGGAPPRVEARFGAEMQHLVDGFNTLADDIAEAQSQLTDRLDELVQANDTKSRFLAMMSHELRTPLNAIIGFSELLETELHGPVGAPAYKEYAGDIRAAGQHLLLLINEILDLNRIESGRETLDEAPIDVAELIHEVAALARFKAESAGVRIEPDAPPPGLTLIGDARRIRQVLVNLLDNALKASPEGGCCRLAATRDAEGGLTLSVTDDGPGFEPPEDLAEPFKTSGATYQREGAAGLGLGLAISARLAQCHGGALAIDSAPGRGAAARLWLPPEKVIEPAPDTRAARA